MKRMICSLLSLFLLTAAAEEIETVDAPLIHTDELPLAVDISPVITFQTDETGVFAVVTVEPLDSSEEVPEPEETTQPAFIITSLFTSHSITYTLTPYHPEGEPN